MAKTKQKIIYVDTYQTSESWELDSQEEHDMCLYLEQLLRKGAILSFRKNYSSFELVPTKTMRFIKSNGKEVQKHLLRPLKYTYDFMIEWAPEYEGKLYRIEGRKYPDSKDFFFLIPEKYQYNPKSFIDVKGTFAGRGNNSAITFPILQKMLYHFYHIYIQKIIPKELIQDTFVPTKLMFTPTGKDRKFNFKTKTLEEFLQ